MSLPTCSVTLSSSPKKLVRCCQLCTNSFNFIYVYSSKNLLIGFNDHTGQMRSSVLGFACCSCGCVMFPGAIRWLQTSSVSEMLQDADLRL